MANYLASVTATSNSSLNTEDSFIELYPPAAVSLFLKRIRVSFPHTTVQDVPARIRVFRTTAAGTTGTALTPTKLRTSAPPATATCYVKNGTAAFTPGSAVANSVSIDDSVNTRGIFEWAPRDDREYIYSDINQRIILAIRVNYASIVVSASMVFEE